MAISWGGYSTILGVRVRAGVEHTVSPSVPATWTTEVTVTTRIYLGAADSGWGNGSWEAYGGASGSGSFSWSLGSGQHTLVATVTTTVPLIHGQSQSLLIGGRIRPFTSSSSTVAKSEFASIPARPISAPAAPTGVTVTRSSDSRQNLSWTRNATTAAPYTSQLVRRQVNGGTYETIAQLSGTATSFVDNGTQAGQVYGYAILAQNSAGAAAGYATPAEHATTPLRPPAPSVAKQASGDIVVARPALSHGATWSVRHVETGTVLATGLTGASWTHLDPSPTQTWTYQVRASSASPVLHSSWSPSSNTIQLIAPALAPTPLGPTVADPSESITLLWRHNPVDGTPQSAYELRSRPAGSSSWSTTGKVTSSGQQRTIPPGSWSDPLREWQVRTWGQHADSSSWSSTAVLTLSARPVADITQPAGTTHDSPQLTVRWSYYDPEGSSQTGWRVELRSGQLVLENRSGQGSGKALTLHSELADGGTYTVRVEVLDGAGLWSHAATRSFTVTYAPPPTPVLQAEFRKDEGYVVLTPDVAPQGDRQPVSHLRVERATADGWQVVQDEVAPGQAVVDMLPPLGTVVVYRAVAVAVIGSVAYSTPAQAETRTKWVFLNHGAGFGQVVRVYGNLEAGRTFSRDKTLKRYAGRSLPVERAGVARERTYSLTGTLFAPWAPPDLTSSYEDFEALADAAAPVCVRDPEGVRMFVSTSGVDLSGYPGAHRRVSLTMTQVDYPEQGLL